MVGVGYHHQSNTIIEEKWAPDKKGKATVMETWMKLLRRMCKSKTESLTWWDTSFLACANPCFIPGRKEGMKEQRNEGRNGGKMRVSSSTLSSPNCYQIMTLE
ncbi:uncharacterized protein RHO17_017116 [Thomomys bottae]